MTLKARLLLAMIPLVMLAVLITAFYSLYAAVSNSTDALAEQAKEKLTSENIQTREALNHYFGTITSQMRDKSGERMVVEAAEAFIPAYEKYTNQRSALSSADKQSLTRYYTGDFAGLYEKRNNRALANPSALVNGLSETSKALQYDFIAGSRFPIGEKDGLETLSNGTEYARVHSMFHPQLRRFLKEFGYYDIFIVDPDSGNIVYTVFKELDFSTSLKSGPYAQTGIGDAYRKAMKVSSADRVVYSSFATYLPSYEAMAGFVASPIYQGNKRVAILIFQIPLDVVGTILTHNKEWQERGFGDSGETYLVSPEGLLVSESRFFLEDPNAYEAAIGHKYPDIAKKVKSAGTSVGIQKVESAGATSALRGESGFNEILDYRDVPVYSRYAPVKIGDTNYALLAEIDVAEALARAQALRNKLISGSVIQLIIVVVVAFVVALWLAARLVKPLNDVGRACASLASGDGDLTVQLPASRIPEINNIIQPFNQFVRQIREIISGVKQDAESLASASEELSAITDQSENTTSQQRDETHMVATAIEQLSASIADVARSTVETRDYGIKAKTSLSENRERANMAATNIKLLVDLIRDSSTVIGSLKDEVNQITQLLNVITSIADQTNLLALNAAIEAARAGEAGRGFSVVADEVRALANRSQENTEAIAKLVENMNQSSVKSVHAMERAAVAADGGIHLVDLVSTAMDELSMTLDKVQEMADTVASAAEEQDVTSNAVSENVARISDMSDDVELGAKHTSEAARELSRIAVRTNDMVARFKV